MNDSRSVGIVEEIATRVIEGQMDPLLGCREVLEVQAFLPEVPDELWDVITGVASEVDGLPIGEERQFWNREVLESKDREAEEYRRSVREVVVEAFEELRASLRRSEGR